MRAVICGAGIAGLTLAWWLERDGWDVTLVEQAPGPRSDGYMMDFFGSGYDVAERMGLLPELVRAHTSITTLTYLDPSGRTTSEVSYRAMAQVLRGRVVSVMRGRLEQALRSGFEQEPDVRYGTSVAEVTSSARGADVGLTDGERLRVDLLVGADGIHSRVRELVLGPERRFLRRLGFHTASYLLDDPDLAAVVGDRILITAEPGRQAGLYPAGDGRLATSLIHAVPPGPLPTDTAGAVDAAYAGLGDLVDRTLAHRPAGGDLYYDEVAQVEVSPWSRGPVTLVGDACGAVSLMAGQGASLAMGGAWLLATELARRPDDVPAALSAYEQRMTPFVRRKQSSGRSTARWMVPDARWRLGVRDRVLGLLDLPGAPVLLRPTMRAAAASVVPGD